MSDKAILVTPHKCIGCRACQVSCKQYHNLKADANRFFSGPGYQNPGWFTPNTWNFISYYEIDKPGGGLDYLFFNHRCMHCNEAGCQKSCPVPGAIYRSEKTGAVIIDESKCTGCKYCVANCPYNVPQYDTTLNISRKCNLCEDRLQEGLEPSCVKSCSTGALTFGDRQVLMDRAKAMVASGEAKSLYGVTETGGCHVLYALREKPETYGLPGNPAVPLTVGIWKDIVKPLGLIGMAAAVCGALVHYAAIGPKKVKEDSSTEEDHHG